jgi:hypothetical protein
MNPRFRKVAVFAGVAALAGGASVGLAAQGSSEAASSNAPMTRPGGAPPGMQGTLPGRPPDGAGRGGTPPSGAPPGFGPPSDGATDQSS